jgi:hypothetical protein
MRRRKRGRKGNIGSRQLPAQSHYHNVEFGHNEETSHSHIQDTPRLNQNMREALQHNHAFDPNQPLDSAGNINTAWHTEQTAYTDNQNPNDGTQWFGGWGNDLLGYDQAYVTPLNLSTSHGVSSDLQTSSAEGDRPMPYQPTNEFLDTTLTEGTYTGVTRIYYHESSNSLVIMFKANNIHNSNGETAVEILNKVEEHGDSTLFGGGYGYGYVGRQVRVTFNTVSTQLNAASGDYTVRAAYGTYASGGVAVVSLWWNPALWNNTDENGNYSSSGLADIAAWTSDVTVRTLKDWDFTHSHGVNPDDIWALINFLDANEPSSGGFLSSTGIEFADYNNDGLITYDDVLMLMRYWNNINPDGVTSELRVAMQDTIDRMQGNSSSARKQSSRRKRRRK